MAKRKNNQISQENLDTIGQLIAPYDVIHLEETNQFIFRQRVPYDGLAPAMIERGWGMGDYKKVFGVENAMKVVEEIIQEKTKG